MTNILKKNNYNTLTIKDFREINDIVNDKDKMDLEKDVSIAAILLQVPEDEIYDNYSMIDLQVLRQEMSFLCKIDTKRKSVPRKIKIGQEEFTLTKNAFDMNVAQYVDFQTIIKQMDSLYDIKYLAQLLSIFLIPKGKKYGQEYDIQETIQQIEENISINQALDIAFFLQKRLVRLIKCILISYKYQLKKMMKMKNQMKMGEIKEKMRQLQILLGYIK